MLGRRACTYGWRRLDTSSFGQILVHAALLLLTRCLIFFRLTPPCPRFSTLRRRASFSCSAVSTGSDPELFAKNCASAANLSSKPIRGRVLTVVEQDSLSPYAYPSTCCNKHCSAHCSDNRAITSREFAFSLFSTTQSAAVHLILKAHRWRKLLLSSSSFPHIPMWKRMWIVE